MGGATIRRRAGVPLKVFQSTLPVGGATPDDTGERLDNLISIHAPRGGSDVAISHGLRCPLHFNPRSPWGERREYRIRVYPTLPISIHAPRGGSDYRNGGNHDIPERFQSTLPVGGATRQIQPVERLSEFQSTLPVGGATEYRYAERVCKRISIHAPRGGSDQRATPSWITCYQFQSTLPVGGATIALAAYSPYLVISIHAPRGGSDQQDTAATCPDIGFQSTLPVGGATSSAWRDGGENIFQSTLPVGGATFRRPGVRVETSFQSTLPVGGATVRRSESCLGTGISIHAPRGGSDSLQNSFPPKSGHFNPRSPWGERPLRCMEE